jgi:hypothetical protein
MISIRELLQKYDELIEEQKETLNTMDKLILRSNQVLQNLQTINKGGLSGEHIS